MSLNIQSFSALTQTQVDQAYDLIAQMVQEHDPSVDTKRGVIKDLVIHLSSILAASNQANIDRVRQSNSLKAINENIELSADEDIVSRVASNYRIIRGTGTVAKGPVVIILNAAKVVTIPAGSEFTTSSGLIFNSDAAYTSRTSSSDVTADTDRLLVNLGNGTYAFTVNVTSNDVGETYRLTRNTSLTPPQIDVAVLRAYAAADFIGGTDVESISDLNKRLQSGIVYKSLANRGCIEGLIRGLELDMFDSTLAISTVGYGDAEMLRYHSIFPVAFGGRADVYVRTQAIPTTEQLTKTATYTGDNGSGQGVWQIVLGRDEVPGLYEITRVTLPADITDDAVASYSITSDVRNYDISAGSTAGTLFLPDIASALEATYTRYQTVTIQFVDTDTSTSGLTANVSTKDYSLIASYMPGLEDIQDAVSDRTTRYPVGDCLIKAPVPCYVSLTINIEKKTTEATPNSSVVKEAAAAAVNGLGFSGRLPASVIIAAVQSGLTGSAAVTSVLLQGQVRKPNGTVVNLTSSTTLDVSTLDVNGMASVRTIGFFLNVDDIVVAISNIDSLSA